MPPTGGFESLKYKRNLPYKGPGAYVLLGGVTAICAYGFYRLGKGNLERRYVVSSYYLRAGLLYVGGSAERRACHRISRSTPNVAFGSGRHSLSNLCP